MPIKLLPKSEIAKRKADARRSDIDEGKKLAKRVDNLRQVAADEEKSLADFRQKAIRTIHADIQKENQALVVLRMEVRGLELAREELMKPLDDERDEIIRAKEDLKIQENELTEREIRIQRREEEVAIAVRKASASLARASTREERSEELLAEISRNRKDGKDALESARKAKEDSERLASIMGEELARRDREMASRERDMDMREKAVRTAEEAVRVERRRLEDRKFLLERSIKRINIKKTNVKRPKR